MGKRPQEDNVIYANFGARTRVSSAEETGQAEPAPNSANALSAPAMRLFNAALRQTDVGRAKRGRAYANGGNVLDVRPRPRGASGEVIGSQNEPFNVNITLPYRDTDDINYAMDALVREAGSIAKLRAGQMSSAVLDILLCATPDEVRFTCDCPDPAVVCKHSVAVAQRTAALIDADPSVILTMRGITYSALEDRKRREAHSLAKENSAPGSPYFWQGHEMPELPRPKVAPMIEDSDIDLLHRAMQTVSFTNIDQLRAVADIEDLYDELTRS